MFRGGTNIYPMRSSHNYVLTSAADKEQQSPSELRNTLIPGLCLLELSGQSEKGRIFAESPGEHHANRQTIWRPVKRRGH